MYGLAAQLSYQRHAGVFQSHSHTAAGRVARSGAHLSQHGGSVLRSHQAVQLSVDPDADLHRRPGLLFPHSDLCGAAAGGDATARVHRLFLISRSAPPTVNQEVAQMSRLCDFGRHPSRAPAHLVTSSSLKNPY